MVPSVGLSESEVELVPIAKRASALALKLLKRPIIRDYLEYTYHVSEALLAQIPNEVDWWDTVDKSSYAKVLAQRHKKPTYDQWMAVRNLKMPDLSTFDGPPMVPGFGGGMIILPVNAPKRREIYEIKPDNNKGLADARRKLKNVEESYSKAALAGVYRRGRVYPPFGVRRQIVLKSRFVDVFRYLTNLYLRPLGISVVRISIQVRQAEPGAVLYNTGVTLDVSGGRIIV
jgi:hypothetical protein